MHGTCILQKYCNNSKTILLSNVTDSDLLQAVFPDVCLSAACAVLFFYSSPLQCGDKKWVAAANKSALADRSRPVDEADA